MVKWTEEGGAFLPNRDGFFFLSSPLSAKLLEDKGKPVALLQDLLLFLVLLLLLPVGVSRLSCLASSAPTYCISIGGAEMDSSPAPIAPRC